MKVAVTGWVPFYVEVDTTEGTVDQAGIGTDLSQARDVTYKPAYGKGGVPPAARRLAEQMVIHDEHKGTAVDWPGWEIG